jgi:hypothetical protein
MTTEAEMEIKKTYRELVRERISETVHQSIGGSPWSDEVEDGLDEFFARFDAAVDGVSVIAEILDRRVNEPAPPRKRGAF